MTVVSNLVLIAGGIFIGISILVKEPCVYIILETNLGGLDIKLHFLKYAVTIKMEIDNAGLTVRNFKRDNSLLLYKIDY